MLGNHNKCTYIMLKLIQTRMEYNERWQEIQNTHAISQTKVWNITRSNSICIVENLLIIMICCIQIIGKAAPSVYLGTLSYFLLPVGIQLCPCCDRSFKLTSGGTDRKFHNKYYHIVTTIAVTFELPNM